MVADAVPSAKPKIIALFDVDGTLTVPRKVRPYIILRPRSVLKRFLSVHNTIWIRKTLRHCSVAI